MLFSLVFEFDTHKCFSEHGSLRILSFKASFTEHNWLYIFEIITMGICFQIDMIYVIHIGKPTLIM